MAKRKKIREWFIATWAKRWFKIVFFLAILIIILRVILSPVATHYFNKFLANDLPGYYGHVDCLRFALWRGAYKMDNIYLNKLDTLTGKQTHFASVGLIDLSIHWKALLDGRLVGEIVFYDADVELVKDKVEPKQVISDSSTFQKLLDVGMPLEVNRFEVHRGRVAYIDNTMDPKVNVEITKIEVIAENLKNTEDKGNVLPSSLSLDGDVYGGTIDLDIKMNPLKKDPTFDLKAEIKNAQLPRLTDFFMAYAKFNVKSGDFNLYTEVAAKDGDYIGYIKPLIQNFETVRRDTSQRLGLRLWAAIAGGVAKILENPNEETIATKVPIQGSFGETHVDLITAVFKLLRNAFIQALIPSLDNDIDMTSLTMTPADNRKPLRRFWDKVRGVDEDSEIKAEEQKREEKEKKKEEKKKENEKK